ncbi:MAG: BMC domain-containing protein [Lachnospiraceae bacterium]|jgi:ethanolamine utilization protein EutS
MEDRITRNQFVETVFKEKFGSSDIKLEGGTFRYKRIRVAGREMTLAHIIGSSQRCVYENLALHIGVHEGEDHTGESIGLMHFSPWETTAVAADIANKAANITIGFLDRFNGSLIILGELSAVRTAVTAVRDFLRDELHFTTCNITES